MQCELFGGPEHDTLCGKTSQGLSVLTPAQTLRQWLERWQGYALTYRTVDGETPEFCSGQPDWSSGPYWMRNGSEFRSGAVASSLSEILETGPIDRRYFLTPKACRGILRRAEKRGKTLPEALHRALLAVADSELTSTLGGGYELSPALTGSGRGTERAGDSRGQDCVIPLTAGSLGAGDGSRGWRNDLDQGAFIPCVIPILEAGARTGTSTNDVRAGSGIGDPGELSLNETSGALNSGGGKPGQGYSAVLVANTLNGNSGRRQIEETLIPTTLRGHSDYGDGFPSLRAKGGDCAGGSEVLVTVGFQSKASANQSMNPSEVMPSMDVGKSDGLAIVFETRFVRNGRGAPDTIVPPLKAQSGETGKGDAAPCVATNSAVRRLLPIECERLQGFPDGHTDIGRADGPRYKALGNSMAVPVIAWIGRRIAETA